MYDTGKVSESVQQLRQGLEMRPAHPAIHYDLALCYLKPGDRANAALHLDLESGGSVRTEGFERKAFSGDFPFAIKGLRMADGRRPLNFVKLFTQL